MKELITKIEQLPLELLVWQLCAKIIATDRLIIVTSDFQEKLSNCSAFLESFDYNEAVRAISSVDSPQVVSQEDAGKLSELIIILMLKTEEVHKSLVIQRENNFITSPVKVLDALREFARQFLDQVHDHAFEKVEFVYWYLSRDLDNALRFLTLIDNGDPGTATNINLCIIAATCFMLDDRPSAANLWILRAESLDPINPEVLRLKSRISLLVESQDKPRIKSSRWPKHLITNKDLVNIINKIVIGETFSFPKLKKTASIVTIGSCFANNLSYGLCKKGLTSHTLPIGEEVNSSYTNLEVFKLLLKISSNITHVDNNDLTSTTLTPLLDDKFIRHCNSFVDQIKHSKALIYTMGVSYGFFSKEDNKPILIKNTGGVDRTSLNLASSRIISPEENLINLNEIFKIARLINPEIIFIISVSPVPAARSFGITPVAQADCISKSILRVSTEMFVSQNLPDVYYWPSFEIVKWLSPHLDYTSRNIIPFFGFEDGYSRHVSKDTVDLVIDLFTSLCFSAE